MPRASARPGVRAPDRHRRPGLAGPARTPPATGQATNPPASYAPSPQPLRSPSYILPRSSRRRLHRRTRDDAVTEVTPAQCSTRGWRKVSFPARELPIQPCGDDDQAQEGGYFSMGLGMRIFDRIEVDSLDRRDWQLWLLDRKSTRLNS